MNKFVLRQSLLLLLTATIWGVAFVAQSVSMDYVGPFTFNAVRCLIGGVVLLPCIAILKKFNRKNGVECMEDETGKEVKSSPQSQKTLVIGGIACGVLLCVASNLQQFGIMYTTVGKAGFITTLYIILVPIASIFLGKKASGKVWIGAALAAVGMYLLCMTETLKLSRGDLLVFICALIFTVHILVIDHFAEKVDGVELSCLQFLVAGVIGWIGAILFEHPVLSDFIAGIVPLAYAGILSCGVAYTLQIIGQKDLDPTVASLILSMESVFSVLAGFVLLQQTLSLQELSGCILVFAAVILVQLPDKKKK